MDFTPPSDWAPMPDDDAARDPAWLSRHALVAVPLDADLAVSLRQKLRESLPHARLVSLERIQHRGLWRAYARKRDDIAFYNDSDANEILLWHGTGERAPAAVLAHQEGLDPRFSSGGFYGQGIYLAERAAYPVGGRYAHRVAGHGGTRFQLLLVRVAAGAVQDFGAEVTAATKKMRFPGRATAGGREREGGRLYDCVMAGPHRPHISGPGGPGDTDASRICVVYQADQMYPAFVCTFDLSFASLPAPVASPVARSGVPAQRAAVPQPTPSQPASPPQPASPAGAPAWYFQDQHLQERRSMITRIAQLMITTKPNPPADWLQKLPNMARRLEETLFRSAASFEEYRDTSTLKRRLQALAIVMGLGPQQQQQAAGPAPASPPAPSLTCPISTGLLVQPMKARPCGHVYSAASARAYFTGPGGKKCAVFGCDKVLKWSDFVKDEALNIRLHKVPEGDDTFFKVKTTTKLQKVFDAYATAKYPGRDLRFLLDGKRLRGDQTPADVDMEERVGGDRFA